MNLEAIRLRADKRAYRRALQDALTQLKLLRGLMEDEAKHTVDFTDRIAAGIATFKIAERAIRNLRDAPMTKYGKGVVQK